VTDDRPEEEERASFTAREPSMDAFLLGFDAIETIARIDASKKSIERGLASPGGRRKERKVAHQR